MRNRHTHVFYGLHLERQSRRAGLDWTVHGNGNETQAWFTSSLAWVAASQFRCPQREHKASTNKTRLSQAI